MITAHAPSAIARGPASTRTPCSLEPRPICSLIFNFKNATVRTNILRATESNLKPQPAMQPALRPVPLFATAQHRGPAQGHFLTQQDGALMPTNPQHYYYTPVSPPSALALPPALRVRSAPPAYEPSRSRTARGREMPPFDTPGCNSNPGPPHPQRFNYAFSASAPDSGHASFAQIMFCISSTAAAP